jgi:hypothetical protein
MTAFKRATTSLYPESDESYSYPIFLEDWDSIKKKVDFVFAKEVPHNVAYSLKF